MRHAWRLATRRTPPMLMVHLPAPHTRMSGQLEVTCNGDLFMHECDVSFDVANVPPRQEARTHANRPPPPLPRAPPPPLHCAAALVEAGGRAVFERCVAAGSPRSYGIVVRGHGSMVSRHLIQAGSCAC